jgi:hypothetical protein
MRTIATRHVAPADRTREALDSIVDAVREAAEQVPTSTFTPSNAAGQAAQALASPLLRLTQFVSRF